MAIGIFLFAPDVIFTPYLFASSKLPEVVITMSGNDTTALNVPRADQKPQSPKVSYKNGNYEERVDIENSLSEYYPYHGRKGYKIMFPKNNLPQGVKSAELIPAENGYADFLAMYRSRKFNLLTPHMHLTRLKLNGRDMGVYLYFEGWTKELLGSEKFPDSSVFMGGDTDESRALRAILNADDATFEKMIDNLVDMEKFYGWDIVLALSQNKYFEQPPPNLSMIFNTATGKFEPYVWLGANRATDATSAWSALSSRILSIKKFRDERDARFATYINNPENVGDDLRFYDQVYRESKTDFFKDFSKTENNFSYIKDVASTRKAVANLSPDKKFSDDVPPTLVKPAHPRFEGAFARFGDIVKSREKFVEENRQFSIGSGNTVVILPGLHFFDATVIIPEGLRVVIMPGSVLSMGRNVSLISYSPVTVGGNGQPVKILPANNNYSWGSFAVIGAGKNKSYLNNVDIKGGSGVVIQGIPITGMIAFHQSDIEIKNSHFSDSADDDNLNVKYGTLTIRDSSFRHTSSDAIDLDFPGTDTIIEHNTFSDIGGDGIDLSQSDISIVGNTIEGAGDKGISVGENSHPTIRDMKITKCDIGIAVKDLSKATISNSILQENRIGVSLYRKKDIFGGGTAELSGVTFAGNGNDSELDELSELKILP